MSYAVKADTLCGVKVLDRADARLAADAVATQVVASTYVLAKEPAPVMPEELADWHRLVAEGGSHEQMYQLPAYAGFKADVRNGAAQVYTLRSRDGGKLLGVIPFSIEKKTLAVGAGGLSLLKRDVNVLVLYGSQPAAAIPEHEKAALYHQLLDLNPQVDAIYLNAYRATDKAVAQLATLRQAGLGAFMEHGIETCHAIEVPSGFAEYESRLSSKKRYNIRRQLRQLEQHAGALTLRCLRDEADVPLLQKTMKMLDAHFSVPDATFQALARHRLMLSCVLLAGGEPVALVLGKHGRGVWHVSNIFIDTRLPASFSVGTSVLHLALEQVIALCAVHKVDFGFGSPGHAFTSTQVQERRARVLLFRAGLKNRLFYGVCHFGNTAIRKALPVLKTMIAKGRQKWSTVRRNSA